MKKIIGTDLDGTLLTSDKRISENTKKAIEIAIGNGVSIVPITGRPIGGLPDDLCDIKGIDYIITSNGAVTYDVVNKRIVRYCGISPKTVIDIYNIVSDFDVIFEVFQNGYGYADKIDFEKLMSKYDGKAIKNYLIKSRRSVNSMCDFLTQNREDIDGISVMFKYDEDCAKSKSKLNCISNLNVIENSLNDIEINHINADKGKAFLYLAEFLNVPLENTVAIGDGSNDYSLLKSAGYAVAMGNAKDDIKKIADVITDDNDNDGVAEFLNKYL